MNSCTVTGVFKTGESWSCTNPTRPTSLRHCAAHDSQLSAGIIPLRYPLKLRRAIDAVRCTGCDTVKPLTEFYRGLRCLQCRREAEYAYKYELSSTEYAAMLRAQGGTCALASCEATESLVVDHDHVTGLVRGILCHQHNVGIGFFADNQQGLLDAMAYLSAQEARQND